MNKSVKLGDISNIITGPFGSQLHQSDYVEEGIPCIMPQNIGNRTLNMEGIARITEDDALRLKRYITEENDIVYARRGDVEKHAFITSEYAGSLCGTGCMRVRVNAKKAYPLYVSFFLNRPECKRWISQNAVGSNMPNLNTEILNKVPIELPEIGEQQEISHLLQSIDSKIQINNLICSELEAVAKTLYDYWFVQFDFPDENGKPYRTSGGEMVWNEQLKREIPKGWEISTIGKTIDKIPNTARIPSSEYLRDGSIPVIDQSSDFIAGYTNNPDSVLKSKSGYIVFGDHTRIVKYIRFPFARGADGTQVLKSNNPCIPEELFYQMIKSIDLSNYGYARHFKFLKDTLIVIPEKNISGNFAEITKPIYEKQAKLVFENIELSKLRDWLLPMLMNGQARVE